jgi:hypothetical protein
LIVVGEEWREVCFGIVSLCSVVRCTTALATTILGRPAQPLYLGNSFEVASFCILSARVAFGQHFFRK